MSDLAIIIVSWNVKKLLVDCLRSVFDDLTGSNLSAQVWVVDNASDDGSAEMVRRDFPNVHLIASDINLGFAGGNNAALRAIGFGQPDAAAEQLPPAVLLLNPDTLVHPDALRTLTEFLARQPQAGIAGAQLVCSAMVHFSTALLNFPACGSLPSICCRCRAGWLNPA